MFDADHDLDRFATLPREFALEHLAQLRGVVRTVARHEQVEPQLQRLRRPHHAEVIDLKPRIELVSGSDRGQPPLLVLGIIFLKRIAVQDKPHRQNT